MVRGRVFPGLYWYGTGTAPAEAPDLRVFGTRFPVFVSALGAALAQAGHLHSLTAANP